MWIVRCVKTVTCFPLGYPDVVPTELELVLCGILKQKKRRSESAVSVFRHPTLQTKSRRLAGNSVAPIPLRGKRINNGRLSCGYFQFCTDNNAVALQTVGRFKGFYRCSVDFGNADQAIAGFDHVKSLGMDGGHCILL